MRYLPALAALAAWLLSGCGGGVAADGDGGCRTSLDCRAGERCLDGNCVAPADGDDEAEDEAEPEADAEPDILQEADLSEETDPPGDSDPPDLPADGDPESDGDPDQEPEPDAEEPVCDPAPTDYTCSMADPSTCPGGLCLLGLCVGPVLNQDRWADCGNGECGPCEDALWCPADCADPPATIGRKEYDNATTLTIWVHGFYNKSPEEMASMVYGRDRGCSDVLENMRLFGVQRPCSDEPGGASRPDQMTGVEYYGGVPDGWLSQDDVAEIEQYPFTGTSSLMRYALVVAKFIRHKLESTGATHVNLACHSMGCYITRFIIERNIEGLAAENRFVRWYTSNGVIAGARLARLYDNPQVRDAAGLIGLELSDFVIMNPDYAMDWTAAWDHKLYEGNNPLFRDMIIHHGCSTDPRIQEAIGIRLLDLNNPNDEPNDGIMYTFDEFFHAQKPESAFHAPGGQVLIPTRTYHYYDHMTYPDTIEAGLPSAANLFNRRRVYITLDELKLIEDRESHQLFDGENGQPPAEVSLEIQVKYNPYVQQTFGLDVQVTNELIAHRSSELWRQGRGETIWPSRKIFAAPVFDGMDRLRLSLKVLEVDWYNRFRVLEWSFDPHQALVEYDGPVELRNHTFTVENGYVRMTLGVSVVELY